MNIQIQLKKNIEIDQINSHGNSMNFFLNILLKLKIVEI